MKNFFDGFNRYTTPFALPLAFIAVWGILAGYLIASLLVLLSFFLLFIFSAIFLRKWWLRTFHKVRFISPVSATTLSYDKISVQGSYLAYAGST
jgi:hypothetical protein